MADDSFVVLFDGVCNLCDRSVQFILDRDSKQRFRFAALQSDKGQELLRNHGQSTGELNSIVLVEGGRCFVRSTAALRIARRLRWPWPMLYAAIVVPAPVRDWIYNWVAANRYRWFGKAESCRIPTPELRNRFLS